MRAIAVSLLAVLAISCGKHIPDDNSSWNVTFYNQSSYSVSVYHNSFSGTLLVDKLASGESYSVMVSPSGNYGYGSVFSVRYWFEVDVDDNVWTTGIDRGMQLQHNIEAGKTHDIQIPNSSNIEWEDAFLKIKNSSEKPIELYNRYSVILHAGRESSISSGKYGIYEISGKIEGRRIVYNELVDSYPLPDFTAENGYIYNFKFDGNSVELTKRQKI
jgi:hypothetical protein